LHSEKLRDSPERSEGEDPFSVACEGKLTVLAEAVPKPKMNLSERSVDKLHISILISIPLMLSSKQNKKLIMI
jgi:hypothetical protein